MRRLKLMVMLSVGIGTLALHTAAPAAPTAVQDCSFKKSVKQGSYVFNITSQPADGCAIQIIEVAVKYRNKQIANFKTDVDFLAENAWVSDLNGDGKPKLAVASRSLRSNGSGTLDVYWLDDKTLRRTTMPDHEEGVGYQGHDTFRLDGSKIVRSFPVYRDGDPDNHPSGGTRTLDYVFSDGKLDQYVKSEETAPQVIASATDTTSVEASTKSQPAAEKQAPALSEPSPTVASQPVSPALPEAAHSTSSPKTAVASKPSIKEIIAGPSFIEIRSTGPLGKFKTLMLDKPARLAIDISGAQSGMAAKSVPISSQGITRARIGTSPGSLRIVLDSTQAVFPAHTVTPTENGLRIRF